MLVRDLMTAGVLSVSPTVPVSFIVELLAERALPGVPVIDTGEVLVGMVTESDLLQRLALSDEPQHGWFRALFDNQDRAADRYARTHGATARDVMTTELWTVDEDIRVAISTGMQQQAWARAPLLSVEVRGGVVELQGHHNSLATRRALSTLIVGIPGVVRVIDTASEVLPGSMSA